MLFSSLIFVFAFLPILIIIYYLIAPCYRNAILLAFSLFFYSWGEPRYVGIMILSIFINYTFGYLVGSSKKDNYRKFYVAVSIFANLVILFYFKYYNFFIDNINNFFNLKMNVINVIMPIGISFFTFQAMSYVVDVYRNEVPMQKNIYKIALYITLFPQLIAGPIVKYHDIHNQLDNRVHTLDKVIYGSYRFITGFSKKIIIANSFAKIVDMIYGTNIEYISPEMAWIGSIFYSLQLYFDFSAYSDMAIGLGSIFGFKFLENFNYPYISKSVTEFWRRWHISLSTWFKEYVYIPLGGNRKSKLRMYVNLFIVFLTTGMWHGASWNFIFWGMWHGFFIILEKIVKYDFSEKNNFKKYMKHIYTLIVVNFGWIFFRADNLSFAFKYIKRMLLIDTDYQEILGMRYYLSNNTIIVLMIALMLSTSVFRDFLNFQKARNKKIESLYCILLVLLFFVAVSLLASSTYNPFIYFRF